MFKPSYILVNDFTKNDVLLTPLQTDKQPIFFHMTLLTVEGISSQLGWGKLLKSTICKVRQRVCLIKSFKLFGCTSPLLRKALFSSFVRPRFTWIYPIFLLLTKKQQDDFSLFSLHWNENFFSFALDEKMLVDRCAIYGNNFLIQLMAIFYLKRQI